MDYVIVYHRNDCTDDADVCMLPTPSQEEKRKCYFVQGIGIAANILYFVQRLI